MSTLNPSTGLWEDDPHGPAPMGQPGALGAQVDTPQTLAPPPVAAAPALPTVAPYAPAPPVAVPAGRVVSPAESATLGSIDANVAAKAGTEQQAGQVGVVKAGAQEAAAARDQDATLKHQQAQQKIIDDAAARATQLQASAKQQWDTYRSMGIKDPEASQSFGHKLLAALAIGLGEYSAKMGGGTNRAAQLIKDANDQNIALQRAAIEKQYKQAELAGQDVTAAKAAETEALRNLDLKHSALLDASAAKLKTELSRMGIPEAQIAANQTVQATEAAALEKREAVNASIRGDTTKLAEADMRATTAAHALAAKKAAHGAGHDSGDAQAQVAAAAQRGASQEELVKLGASLHLKDPLATAIKVQKDPEKLAALEVRGTDGNVLGTASSTKGAQKAEEQLTASQAYRDAILAYKEHIEQEGRLINPLSDAYKERERLHADVVARGRKAMDLGVSNANLQLEHQVVGGAGTGFSRMSSPESLQKLADEADKVAKARIATSLRPGQRVGSEGALPSETKPAASPAAPDRRALAQKAIDDPNAPPAVKARALQILRGQ